MYRKRAALVTLNSISKASFSSSFNPFFLQNLLHFNKTITLFNNFSTSAERLDFYNETHFDFYHSQQQQQQQQQHPFTSVHQQNPIHQTPNNRIYRETWESRNVVNKNKLVGQDRNFSQNPKENYGSNGGDVVCRDLRQSQEAAVGVDYNGNSREFAQNLNTQYGNFSTGYLKNSNGFIDSQQSAAYASGGEFIQNRNENRFQANVSSVYKEDNGKFQQKLNGSYGGNVEGLDKNKTGYQVQLNDNGFRREGSIGLLQNPIGIQRGAGDCVTPTDAGTNTKLAEVCTYEGTIEELDTFCKANKVKEALEVLEILEKKGVTVDLPRYVLLIQACGNIGFLPLAKSAHAHLIRSEGRIHQVYVYNMILEMYSKCRSMCDAHEVFENMPERNLTSWDTMITGFAKNGHGEDAIDLFTQFKQAGLTPDGQMFMGVFLACSVVCDIDEGMLHFESMSNVYGIVPTMEHYTGVVKMLGSVGYLDEAMEFIEKIPFKPTLDVWETLLNLCRLHGNIVLEDQCTMIVNYFDPSWLKDKSKEEAYDIAKEVMKTKVCNEFRGLNKTQEAFLAGDTYHAGKDITYALLRQLNAHMKEAGYYPATRTALHDVDDESKEESLLSHSERLAAAHGLLNSSARLPIRIMKNLRVCVDCHNALKFIAKIVGRELIIRDAKRFHHFKDGLCSCKDYW
ncbi:hypothetical protein AQUCO_02000241v1 [Aquilegia coerulea]|uniref:DYW domain-containing protein n=1 Tax=Aquilegia coerulea TaxID=218851 RepID=A0A2G5DGL3_AQUCA|nr:hypothetical protein AQUCO_02000241v1 [Aquilegia coerulea]